MKILFVIGDGEKSPDRQLADAARKLIGKDAQVIYFDGSPLRTYGELDGVWFFVHDERGGCPASVMNFLEKNFSAIEDIPTVATGVGGKEGGMNAVTEIFEYVEAHGGRLSEGEPLCIPLRSAKLDLDHDEKMDLFFLVDSFLKYCGMDDSDSRKIGFEKVVNDYLKLLKYFTKEEPNLISLKEGELITDSAKYDTANLDDAPPEIKELHYEIETLTADYELEDEEILPALKTKILTDW